MHRYTSQLAITEQTQSPAIGTMISDTTVVTITVTDEYGNTDNCTFTYYDIRRLCWMV
jgi:hypothetical protein